MVYNVAKSEEIFLTLEKVALVVVLHRSSDQLLKLGECSSSSKVLLRGCQYKLKRAFVLESFMDPAEVPNYCLQPMIREKLKTSFYLKWYSSMDRRYKLGFQSDFCCADFMRSYWRLTSLENGTTCLYVWENNRVSMKCLTVIVFHIVLI